MKNITKRKLEELLEFFYARLNYAKAQQAVYRGPLTASLLVLLFPLFLPSRGVGSKPNPVR